MTNPRCIREGDLKYIDARFMDYYEELHNFGIDDRERTNLLRGGSDAANENRQRLRALLDAWADEADPLISDYNPAQNELIRRRLEALGYIGGGDDDE